ncbi:MAG TPA: hypothetical protein DHW20_01765 [Gemmatimonadetes bacterium]|nr:hypothetical protein [Gemmatimonadota bacterium]|tara:strand:+ start:15549 stop:16073 length:525 start_codon:yes stop_codon:yes gene_type:complete
MSKYHCTTEELIRIARQVAEKLAPRYPTQDQLGDVEEVAAEIIVGLLEKPPGTQALAFVIARRRGIDYLRKLGVYRRPGTEHGAKKVGDVHASVPDRREQGAEEVEAADLQESLRAKIACQNPALLPVFDLMMRGHGYKFIVESLGMSHSTVSKYIFDIRYIATWVLSQNSSRH